LYAGQLDEKTNLKSKETHSSIQGKRRQPIRARHSASHGLKGPQLRWNRLNFTQIAQNRHEGPPSSHPAKDEASWGLNQFGRIGGSAEPVWSPTDLIFHVTSPHLSPRSVPRSLHYFAGRKLLCHTYKYEGMGLKWRQLTFLSCAFTSIVEL
jgi:hypothetical protein